MNLSISAKKGSTYNLLPEWAKYVIAEFFCYCEGRYKNYRKQFFSGVCTLLYHLSASGNSSIRKLNCSFLVNFRLQNGYFQGVPQLLNFLATEGIIKESLIYSYDLHCAQKLKDIELLAKDSTQGPSIVQSISYPDACRIVIDELKTENYSRTITVVAKTYMNTFETFLEGYGLDYSVELVKRFIDFLVQHNNITDAIQYKRYLLLVGYAMVGTSIKEAPTVFHHHLDDKLPSWFLPYYEEYRVYRKRNHIGDSALSMDRSTLIRFAEYVDSIGIHEIGNITYEVIKGFYLFDKHTTAEGKAAYTIKLRLFLSYMYECGHTKNNLARALSFDLHVLKSRPTQILSDDIYNMILDQCEEWEQEGAVKNSLILKIAMWTGLRCSDICSLSIANIDWNQQLFRLIQKKTGVELEIPFPTAIGNLLYEYLKSDTVKDPHSPIFLNNRAPHRPITTIYIRRLIQKATGGAVTKAHILRKTFATRMLRNNTPISMISDTLGHISNDTVDPYIDTNDSMMRLCGLPIPEYTGGLHVE